MGIFDTGKQRKAFNIATKKREWSSAAGPGHLDAYMLKKQTPPISRCRECPTKLRWGEGGYNFDHRDNNPANNSQRNCYLVCSNCHSKATKIRKVKAKGFLGQPVIKTQKIKVSYKKQKRG